MNTERSSSRNAITPHSIYPLWPGWRLDAAIGLATFLSGIGISLCLSSLWPAELINSEAKPFNVWFFADANIVYENMTNNESNHYRTNRHPLFSMLTHPIVANLLLLGAPPWLAVRWLVATAAGTLLVLIYSVLRLLESTRLDALLGSMLLASSASFIFWAGVPETFVFGGVTILATLAFSAFQNHRATSTSSYIAVICIAISVTITNVSVALAALWFRFGLRSALIAAKGLLLVLVLWLMQKLLYPSAGFFLGNKDVLDYVFMDGVGTVSERVRNIFIHSVVMPDITLHYNPWNPDWSLLSIEHAPINTENRIYLVTIIGWIILVTAGMTAIAKSTSLASFRSVLLVSLAFQVLLHMVFGDEVFLYSLHWVPMLVIITMMSTRTYKPFVIHLTASAIVLSNPSINYQVFLLAIDLASH